MSRSTGWIDIISLAAEAPRGSRRRVMLTVHGRFSRAGAGDAARAEFRFELFDMPSGGRHIAATEVMEAFVDDDGRVLAKAEMVLPEPPPGPLWLELAVRRPAGSGRIVVMSPRQAVVVRPGGVEKRQLSEPCTCTMIDRRDHQTRRPTGFLDPAREDPSADDARGERTCPAAGG